MSDSKFIILLITNQFSDDSVKQIRNKLSTVVDEQNYAFALYYDKYSDAPIPPNVILAISTLDTFDQIIFDRLKNYYLSGGNVLLNSGSITSEAQACLDPSSKEEFLDQGSLWTSKEQGTWIGTVSDLIHTSTESLAKMLSRILRPKLILKSVSSFSGDSQAKGFITKANLLADPVDLVQFRLSLSGLSSTNILVHDKLVLDFSGGESDDIGPIKEGVEFVQVSDKPSRTFDWNIYKTNLATSQIGRVVIHSELTGSTMNYFDSSKFLRHGLAVVADRQISGKGRAGNTWLSPEGCAMFSMELEIPSTRWISVLQHIVALALVHSVRTLEEYKDLDIRLKWPNDIYFGKHTKLGGVLVMSSFFRNKITSNVGMGVNLNNDHPTICINKVIRDWNAANPEAVPLNELSREQVLARTFNQMESLMEIMGKPDGFEKILELYYNYWLHQDQEVTVRTEGFEDVETKGTIIGIDENGYLLVKLQETGQVVSVHHSNNSLDMMQGLIMPKVIKD